MSKELAAELFYTDYKAKYINVDPINYPEKKTDVFDFIGYSCVINNARDNEGDYSVEKNGFELVNQRSAYLNDIFNSGQQERYSAEVAQLISKRMGSPYVKVLNLIVRGEGGWKPLLHVHNDYNDDHAWSMAKKSSNALDRVIKFDFIQTWRPIYSVLQHPLAFCDARSVQNSDLMAFGRNYMIRYNSKHQWSYFPKMTPNELLVFRTYSSDQTVDTRITPHTSFVDPSYPVDAFPRHSIETRAIVLYV